MKKIILITTGTVLLSTQHVCPYRPQSTDVKCSLPNSQITPRLHEIPTCVYVHVWMRSGRSVRECAPFCVLLDLKLNSRKDITPGQALSLSALYVFFLSGDRPPSLWHVGY